MACARARTTRVSTNPFLNFVPVAVGRRCRVVVVSVIVVVRRPWMENKNELLKITKHEKAPRRNYPNEWCLREAGLFKVGMGTETTSFGAGLPPPFNIEEVFGAKCIFEIIVKKLVLIFHPRLSCFEVCQRE